jgi:hypothetical protein
MWDLRTIGFFEEATGAVGAVSFVAKQIDELSTKGRV